MAKKSKIAKLHHQEALVKKYAEKRKELKAKGDYIGLSKLLVTLVRFVFTTVTVTMADHMPTCVSLECHGLDSVN